jgi:hypothetical protein
MTNPFYALSVSAMLLGCWLLSRALHLQAGQLGGLLALMAVLQLYEGLLVWLGTFLVRSGRARRDGLTILLMETLFLMDAPLLATECVTADPGAGTAVVLATFALAVLKLAWVRRAVPGLLSARAVLVLAAQSAFVLAVPVAAVHLAGAGRLDARSLWLLWWAALALPFAQRRLREEARRHVPRWSTSSVAWTWAPGGLVVVHLWAAGYVHAIPFQPAFLSPLLLGLALTAGRDEEVRKVALPALALVVSLGQAGALGWALPGLPEAIVSPFHVAALAVVVTWGYLAWRDRDPWVAILAGFVGSAGLVGLVPSGAWRAVGRVLLALASHRPRGAFGWGVLAVVAGFVLLGAGARRSLAVPAVAARGHDGAQPPVGKPDGGR